MKIRIAQFINIFLLFLVTGVFWGTWFSLARSMTYIAPETFLEVGRTMIHNLKIPMATLMPLSLISTVITLLLLYQQRSMRAFYLTLTGLTLFIGALLITLLVNVPIDNQIKLWSIETLPGDWNTIRDRWELYHTLRTFTSLTGLGFVLSGALTPTTKA